MKTDEPAPKPQVSKEMDSLEEIADSLKEHSEMLITRLSTVLPDGPLVKEDESKPTDPGLVPLAARIDRATSKLKTANLILERLLNCLEL